ncbi:Lnb N-terminal periplasmic domain-containing protein [Psychrobacter sp. AOP7-A1-24]|uniref:Lnb N-terminal periplasmic domain-containing protein n=1 Tax=Psychrobacter sp. AOP7-A1-24 TaxID=3457646 RepID=UPI00402BBA64
MSIKLMSIPIDCTLMPIGLRASLPLAVAGILFSAQAQAFLPTPLSVLETEALSPDASSIAPIYSDSDVLAEPKDINSTEPNIQNSTLSDSSVATNQLLSTWRQQVKVNNLAQHTTWRRLLYFYDDHKSVFGKKKTESLVDDPSFFLSKNGQRDSDAELDAMLVALVQELASSSATENNQVKTDNNSNSVLCRFPARVAWLTEMLAIDAASLSAECPKLDEWMSTLAPEQLSIMFAQEYLDNPLSAFAHTLLRIDSKASIADPNQIDKAYALNYTVDGDPNDSFPIYATKSMIGSYDSAIEIDPYPEMLAKYLQDDERDAWTYQLSLTPAEVQKIMRHVWETKALKMPYYFTTDNCASEILRLIDVVRPQQNLLSQLSYAVVPSDVIQLLNNEQLLASTIFTPADNTLRQAQLNERKQQRAQLGYYNSAKQTANEIKSAQLNPVSSMSDDGQILLKRQIDVSDNNPIDRHPLQLGTIAIGQRGDNDYMDVGFRAGFHDTLDHASGYPQFFNLEGLAATLRLYDTDDNKPHQPDSVVLQNVTLIRGRSFNPVNTAKKGNTWGASIEATRVNDGSQEAGTDHLVGSVGYEKGWSWAFGTPAAGTGEMPSQLCYTFLAGTGQLGRGINKGFRLGAGINAGCRYQINNQLRAQAELQLPYWYHGSNDESNVRGHYWQPISSLGLQYDIDKKQALRINANYEWQERIDANDDIQLSYRRYF